MYLLSSLPSLFLAFLPHSYSSLPFPLILFLSSQLLSLIVFSNFLENQVVPPLRFYQVDEQWSSSFLMNQSFGTQVIETCPLFKWKLFNSSRSTPSPLKRYLIGPWTILGGEHSCWKRSSYLWKRESVFWPGLHPVAYSESKSEPVIFYQIVLVLRLLCNPKELHSVTTTSFHKRCNLYMRTWKSEIQSTRICMT